MPPSESSPSECTTSPCTAGSSPCASCEPLSFATMYLFMVFGIFGAGFGTGSGSFAPAAINLLYHPGGGVFNFADLRCLQAAWILRAIAAIQSSLWELSRNQIPTVS